MVKERSDIESADCESIGRARINFDIAAE